MAALVIQKNALQGERVAFTGRLQQGDHRRALAVVAAAGGIPAPRVTRSSTLLVVGMRGWRGLSTGTVNGPLRQAEAWQQDGQGPRIIAERAFWARVSGNQAEGSADLPTCTPAQAARLTGLTAEQLRRCAQLGLVRSEEDGLCFEDLLAVRAIVQLMRQGVTLAGMAGKWAELSRLLPMQTPHFGLHRLINDPLAGLALQLADGVLVDSGGQLLLPLQPPGGEGPQSSAVPAEDLTAGALAKAQALLEQDRSTEAEALLRQSLARQPQQGALQLALGELLLEKERYTEAEGVLRRLLAEAPTESRALFALALCCEENEKRQEAVPLWRAYLRLAPTGERAVIAMAQLLRPLPSPTSDAPADS
jgi:tetratricopeptide (TPR) repeat protein